MKGSGMTTHMLSNISILQGCGCINDNICKGYINEGCKLSLVFYDYHDIKKCKGYRKKGE